MSRVTGGAVLGRVPVTDSVLVLGRAPVSDSELVRLVALELQKRKNQALSIMCTSLIQANKLD